MWLMRLAEAGIMMDVYCGKCKHFSEQFGVSDYHQESCAIAGTRDITIPGDYRSKPRNIIEVIRPSEKNKNNDCTDWEVR